MLAPIGGASVAGITFLETVLGAATGVVRGGAATRAAGASRAGTARAASRAVSGRTVATGAPPPGAALSEIGGVGMRCDAGMSGAGLGGGGATGGVRSFSVGAGVGGVGFEGAPDCAAAGATAMIVANASSFMDVMG